MDSPVAAKLGPSRAFFFSEDQGKMEKFRPYGILTTEFLSEYKAKDPETPTAAAEPTPPSPNGENGNGHAGDVETKVKEDAGS